MEPHTIQRSDRDGDENSVAERTIDSVGAFLQGVDDDDILDDLVHRSEDDGGQPTKRIRLVDVGAFDDTKGGKGDGALCRGGDFVPKLSTGAFAGVSADAPVNAPGDNVGAAALTLALSPQEIVLDSTETTTVAEIHQNPSIGYEGAKKTKRKRGPYKERRESWTTTQGDLFTDRLSGTISTKKKSNPLPQYNERFVVVSEMKTDPLQEEMESTFGGP